MLLFNIPPAETRLSWTALSKGFIPGRSDFSGKIRDLTSGHACILAGSARVLLYLLFKELRSQAGPEKLEVLLPGYTCYSVAAAAVKAGLRVALYDLDPRTFQPDRDCVKRALSGRTLAVVGQNLLGLPADFHYVAEAARRHNVCFVQDAAQRLILDTANPASDQADFTMYSFGRGKPLPLGQGGALVANRLEVAIRLDRIAAELSGLPKSPQISLVPMFLRMLSWPRIYWVLEKMPLGLGQTVYDPGFKVAAMGMAYQRIGHEALDELDWLNRHRTMISAVYAREFGCASGRGSQGQPSFIRYPVFVDSQDRVGQLAHLGVRRAYPQSLCDVQALRPELAEGVMDTPGARNIAGRMITLPTHMGVSEYLAKKIVNEVKKVFSDVETVGI